MKEPIAASSNFPTITVAISTISDNFETFITNFRFSSLFDADEVIIIIQGKADKSRIDALNKNFIVLLDDGTGVSRSRNIAIQHSKSDFIWFMDDDIRFKNNAISIVKNYISRYEADVFTVRTICLNTGKPYKIYPNKNKLNRRDIIGVSTVEIIASRQLILNSKVIFNESLGLGTKYPSCEENIFLLDLYDLGAHLMHIPEFVQKHAPFNYRKAFTNPKTLFAKGVFCKRYNGMTGFLLIFYWILRSIRYGASIKNSINLIYGYNSGDELLI